MALALAPFVIVPMGLHAAVSRAGVAFARQAGTFVARLAAEQRRSVPTRSPEVSPPDEAARAALSPAAGRSATRARGPTARTAPATPVSIPPASAPARSRIVISADRALELAPRLGTVRAATVHDTQGRSVGAGLSGVSALGAGLEDGDVVTDIAGRPTPTGDEAVAVALALYASGARVIRGTIVRRGDPIEVTVSIPAVR